MKMSVARQLALLAAALTFLVLLIGSLAFVSWREIRDLRSDSHIGELAGRFRQREREAHVRPG